jgi:hypothetical protein
MADLAAKGITVTEAQIGLKMGELMAQALLQVQAGV